MVEAVALSNARDLLNVGGVSDVGQRPHRHFNGTAKVRGLQHVIDVGRAQVAGNIGADRFVRQVGRQSRRFLGLEDLAAEVGHDDLTGDRVVPIGVIDV